MVACHQWGLSMGGRDRSELDDRLLRGDLCLLGAAAKTASQSRGTENSCRTAAQHSWCGDLFGTDDRPEATRASADVRHGSDCNYQRVLSKTAPRVNRIQGDTSRPSPTTLKMRWPIPAWRRLLQFYALLTQAHPLGMSTILPTTPPFPSNSCACLASARGNRCAMIGLIFCCCRRANSAIKSCLNNSGFSRLSVWML